MLILPHSSLLDDGLLNADDSLQKFKENQAYKDEQYKLPDQEQLTNAVAQVGRPMASQDFIKKVTQLNKRLWAEDSWGWSNGSNFYTVKGGEKICCGSPFEKGFMPEFTIVHENERGLPEGKTVGWRAVLSALIQHGYLKKSKVDQVFGCPSPNAQSKRWYLQTRQFN